MIKRSYPILIIIAFETLLTFIAFKSFFLNPNAYLFSNVYDGFKNYLTFHSYIQQEKFSLIYQQMNYPFGEFISFTDNTPLLALCYKSISTIFPVLKDYDISFYNIFNILTIIISAILLFKIFKLLEIPLLISIITSIILPWLSPQFERLFIGHFNLSYSWVLLFSFWLFIRFFQKEDMGKKTLLLFFFLFLLFSIAITFIHIYYLAIIYVYWGIFSVLLFVYALIINNRKKLWKASCSFLILLVSGLICTLMLWVLDSKSGLRQSFAEGYGFDDWTLSFRALYKVPEFIPFREWLKWEIKSVSYESKVYLGVMFWLSLIFFTILFLFRRNTISKIKPLVWGIFVTGLFSLSIALGEKLNIFGHNIINFLNPFYYIHFLTDRIEQFRCISRFSWMFYWSTNISVIFFLGMAYKQKIFRWGVIFILMGGIYETFFTIRNAQNIKFTNVFQKGIVEQSIADLVSDIDLKKYQAILPIPFYHVGCENYDYTIDPEEDFFQFTTLLSLATNLPNMGSKMSRTPIIEAQSLMSIFREDIGKINYLQNRLKKNKPILIIYDKIYYTNLQQEKLPQRAIPKGIILNGQNFIKSLKYLQSSDKYILYELDL